MRKICVAQIGIGHDHSARVLQSMCNQPELFQIAGYAFTEKEERHVPVTDDIHEGYRMMEVFSGLKKMSVEEIMADSSIEAVVIETEEAELFRYSLLAAQNKKHIHMDKPGSFDLAEYEKILALVRENGTVFHTGYMYRYNPFVQELLKAVQNGELGEIIHVYADMSCSHNAGKREWIGSLPGGLMFFLGCHMVDLVLQLQGAPEEVIPLNCTTGKAGVRGTDFGMAAFRYPHGVSIVKSSASEIGGFVQRKLIVSGTKKTVRIEPLEEYDGEIIKARRTTYSSEEWTNEGNHASSLEFTRFEGMMNAFAQMVAGEVKNPYSADYELLLYKTLLKCCE